MRFGLRLFLLVLIHIQSSGHVSREVHVNIHGDVLILYGDVVLNRVINLVEIVDHRSTTFFSVFAWTLAKFTSPRIAMIIRSIWLV